MTTMAASRAYDPDSAKRMKGLINDPYMVKSVIGKYEYIKGGKDVMTVELKADKTCVFTEHTETFVEIQDSYGEGYWCIRAHIDEPICDVRLNTLTKKMTFKVPQLVPGIGDGTVTEQNVMVPIAVALLAQKAKFGSNKWRVVA